MIKTLDDVYSHLQKDDVNLSTKFTYSSPKTDNKTKNMSLGRIWFNLLLPDDFPLIDEPVDKRTLKKIIQQLFKKYDNVTFAKLLEKIKRESFKLATIQPVSYSIDDLILPDFSEKRRQEELFSKDLSPEEFHKKALEITQDYLDWLKDNNSQTYRLITSGAKGSIDLLCALMIGRGSTIDIENEIGSPIKKALIDGYDIKEYFQASKVARRAFYIVAKGTAQPGALARRMMFANANIQLVKGDCKTNKY